MIICACVNISPRIHSYNIDVKRRGKEVYVRSSCLLKFTIL
ncbi:unnamed protein product [Brugia timori]|uniref:Uncharacterized protein n=1 Tax=Brugia timori TaxID=42155 RepID=A0A0R3QC41_9BILA|nr:unnamed protein product [Brugia timori]